MPIYWQYYIYIIFSHSRSDRQSVRNQCYGYSGCERGPNIFKSDAVLHFVFVAQNSRQTRCLFSSFTIQTIEFCSSGIRRAEISYLMPVAILNQRFVIFECVSKVT